MKDNEINICNTLGNGNEKRTKISNRNASRQVNSFHKCELVKYYILVQNGLFHNGISTFT